MPWLQKRSPQEELERQLLHQWQAGAREHNLQLLPFRLLLAYLRSVETEAERNARMALLPVHQRLLRQTARKMLSVSVNSVKKPLNWLSRQPCLQPLRVRLVNLKRRCLVNLVLLLLRLRPRSPGSRKC